MYLLAEMTETHISGDFGIFDWMALLQDKLTGLLKKEKIEEVKHCQELLT